uniref:Mitochondrial import inner membrane translocase subunit TIM50 n=1 Tax=Tetradesmus obliquus TaxID=3088 RepID=A0A383WGB0_TETOB|eukprot:jgi/Sobl393_1/7813/SZX76303.1
MSVPRFVTDMPIPLAAVEISSNASAPLLKLQQLQLSTAALLLGLWQLLQGLTIALLASLVAKTAAAKSSLKENARCSLLLLKHASRSTTGHIATWLRIHIRSSRSRGGARICRSGVCVPAAEDDRICSHSQQQLQGPDVSRTAGCPVATGADVKQQRCLLLPPRLPHHSGRLTVVLDLDETLLCTYRLQQGSDSVQLVPNNSSSASSGSSRRHSLASMFFSSASSLCSSASSRRSSCGSSSSSSSSSYSVTCSSPCEGTLGMLGREVGATCWLHYTPTSSSSSHSSSSGATTTLAVFERPGVRQFLQELSSFAEVVLFTAASAAYAAPLADLLDPQGQLFAARLYGDACVAAGGRAGVKDLGGLGRALGRVVLVDNSPYSFLLQPANGLPCLPFHGQRSDGQLLGVILPLLRSLAQLGGDIRPLLEAKFRVRGWLASKGVEPPPEACDELWG